MANKIIEERTKRTQWFMQDRFGMFIHWGLYAIPSRGEWVRNAEQLSLEDYQPYFNEFNPTDYNPKKWARLAKEAGMKYAVLTAKHHDGFCLFDSQLTDYKSTNTPCGRDLVREFLDAFRAEGLKVGLYYSLLDWHHPDYPHYEDRIHPMRKNEAWKGVEHHFENYLSYFHGQVKELLTNYGKLDIMWFDFSYDNMCGETWEATKLVQMIRSIQPDIIIDNRLEINGQDGSSIKTEDPAIYSGDFVSPEQMIPPEGMTDQMGNPLPWEACITLNNHWGYCSLDKHYKSAKMVIHMLAECVSKNGNLLLNVGPDAKGRIPAESEGILCEVGEWMADNGSSIYHCGKAEFPKPEWGRYTQNGNKLYAHIMEECISGICLADLGGKIEKVRLLADGSELQVKEFWNLKEYGNHAFFMLNSDNTSFPLPDEKDTVVEITLK